MPTVTDRLGHYPSDLSDQQWQSIKHLVPPARGGGRSRTTDIRRVIEGVLYLVSSGCAWRYLPADFPPWQTVYHYFRYWCVTGTWRQIHNAIRDAARVAVGRDKLTTYLIIDSQSVKAHYGESRGLDGFKRVRGRKRQILVDTQGLIHSVYIHAANLSDTKEGINVVDKLSSDQLSKVSVVHADLGYRGSFEEQYYFRKNQMPLINRKDEYTGQGKKKTVAEKLERKSQRHQAPKEPKRWIVERTFAWFIIYRRLSRDYEKLVSHSENMIYLAMTQLMLRRLYHEYH